MTASKGFLTYSWIIYLIWFDRLKGATFVWRLRTCSFSIYVVGMKPIGSLFRIFYPKHTLLFSLQFWLNDDCLGEVFGQLLPTLGEVYKNIYVKQIFENKYLI